MKFEAKNTLMYIYKNIIVSGDHLVLENNKWIRVCNSKNAIFIPQYNERYIYCLQTEFNVILINDTIFSDYMEINDIILNNKINNLIKNHLNNEANYNNIGNKETFNDSQNIRGFSGDTLIKIYDNKNKNCIEKKISNIEIGDFIINDKKYVKVTGIIKFYNDNVKLFNYFYNIPEIIVSGSQLVFENNKWIMVCESKYSSKFNNNLNVEYLYNLCTEDNILPINNIKFRDFNETNDIDINNTINKEIESFKNNHYP